MPRPITQDLVYELTGVSSPSISPDGDRLAFVRTVTDREQGETRSQIMMMSLPDGELSPFTQGSKDAAPRFSPDGRSIAFVRPDDKDRKQLWLMPTAGGEARRLTDLAGGVGTTPGRPTPGIWPSCPMWTRTVYPDATA